MQLIRKEDLMDLGARIENEIKKEFAEIHLSGNLMNTIEVSQNAYGEVVVNIPAIRYDVPKYRAQKVLVFNPGDGSYAEDVNKTGGFSGKHVGYMEKAIDSAISSWLLDRNITLVKEEEE